ncbi:hypothetical protein R1flu_025679 [Riccia fluitans]|uniref:Ribosomal protein L34 n=1 Tax=Riccia fluitans TaxID=41844 RepID=A0ABD1XYG0_9MARC
MSPPQKRRRVYKANFGTNRIRPQRGHVVRRDGGRTRTPKSSGTSLPRPRRMVRSSKVASGGVSRGMSLLPRMPDGRCRSWLPEGSGD